MLQVLINSCSKNNLLLGSKYIQIINRVHKIKSCGGHSLITGRNYASKIGARVAERKGLRLTEKILLGGIAVGFVINKSGILVKCEVNYGNDRLVGFKYNEKEIKFDWRKLWFYLKPHIWKLLMAVIAALAVAFCNIKIPNFLGQLINVLAKYTGMDGKPMKSGSFFSEMKSPIAKLFGIYTLHSMFTFVYIHMLSKIGEQMAATMRRDLFEQVIIQDMSFFDENRTGELVNRIISDVHEFKSCFKQFVSQGLKTVAQLIGGTISLLIISPHLAAIALVSVPSAVFLMSMMGRALRHLSKKTQSQLDCVSSLCEEAYSNIRTVRSCASEFNEVEMFERESNKVAEYSQELGYGIAVFQGLTNLFLNGMVATTLFLGGKLMSSNYISAGDLMAFLVASQNMQKSLSQGSVLLGTLIKGIAAGSRVFEYLALEPQVKLLEGIEIPKDKLTGDIRFENVSFAYPSRPNHVVLENFSLTIKQGQTVAIVGASGSGKSTVAALLSRFYEPLGGRIVIDGHELSSLSPNWLRGEVIGLIDQQPILFATSIFENIKYGKFDAHEPDVYAASKMSQSHEFIETLPDAYNTKVGERGAQLSGGQRQRIAIARALLKDPTILILDEATSALDASSEAIVMDALKSATKNRTTLMIAHRLSTVKHADMIVVMKSGQIMEMGNHNDLMSRKGLYFELVQKQEKQEAAGQPIDD